MENAPWGARVSQAVFDNVLTKGQEYLGRVFVVDAWYIGRYEPLRDHAGKVIGMLYVGVREAVFKSLVDALIALPGWWPCYACWWRLSLPSPLADLITRPIVRLAEANRRLADGDMHVRVEPYGRGEISLLGRSFNSMARHCRPPSGNWRIRKTWLRWASWLPVWPTNLIIRSAPSYSIRILCTKRPPRGGTPGRFEDDHG